MDQSFKTIEYRGHNINIYQDEFVENPRTGEDNVGTMICFHNRYELGDTHSYNSPLDFLKTIVEENNTEEEIKAAILTLPEWTEEDRTGIEETPVYYFRDTEEPLDFYLALLDGVIILPLYLYDHSGITIRTSPFSCSWDSGQIGWIYVTHGKALSDYGFETIDEEAEQKIETYLTGEVETYDQYLTGNVYGYVVEPKENNKGIVCTGSCWGFYGQDFEENSLLDSARSCIDYEVEQYTKTATGMI